MKKTINTRILSLLVAVLLLFTATCGMFVTTQAATISVIGDLDGDGGLTTTDVRAYLILLVNSTPLSAEQKRVADANVDGDYSTSDVRQMLQTIVNEPAREVIRSIWIPYMEVEELLVSKDPATCRAAINACLDDCVAKGANTVYFHVRANSDAYYDSDYFNPNAKTAALLSKGFDPLACAVELAHAKGLKIEAWVNPYRIGSDISRAKADATFQYNNRYYYVPSDDAVQALVVNGVKELVNNYAIDGIQFDDYFYPEGCVSATEAASFEQADYTAYKTAGGTLGISDWRRAEVNKLVAACFDACHSRYDCVFGISPGCNIDTNYNEMYADAATWANNPGYIDYLAPQLYVGFNHIYTPYDKVLKAWDDIPRLSSVSMVAGLALYKTGLLEDTWAGSTGKYEWVNNSDILSRQVALTKTTGWDGIGLYSHQSFEIGTDRNATVAEAENSSVCNAWLTFR